jgi:hypothetical protein
VIQATWAANGIYPAGTALLNVAITPAAATGCANPPQGLNAWYKGEGNPNDVTGAYAGTAGGDLAYAPGKVGQAFSFDGSQSPYMGIPAGAFPPQPGNGPFSFEAWFETLGGGVILGEQNAGGPYVPTGLQGYTPAIYVDTNGDLESEMFSSGGTPNPVVSSYAVNDGQWHHVAVSFDGTTEITYLDGAAIGTAPGTLLPA